MAGAGAVTEDSGTALFVPAAEPSAPDTVGEHADDSDFMLFVFGETKADDGSPSGNYELHIFFTINGTWINVLVDGDPDETFYYMAESIHFLPYTHFSQTNYKQ